MVTTQELYDWILANWPGKLNGRKVATLPGTGEKNTIYLSPNGIFYSDETGVIRSLSGIGEWQAQSYGPGLIIVLHDNKLYRLSEATSRPFVSADFAAELEARHWQALTAEAELATFTTQEEAGQSDSFWQAASMTIQAALLLLGSKLKDLRNTLISFFYNFETQFFSVNGQYGVQMGAGDAEYSASTNIYSYGGGLFFNVYRQGGFFVNVDNGGAALTLKEKHSYSVSNDYATLGFFEDEDGNVRVYMQLSDGSEVLTELYMTQEKAAFIDNRTVKKGIEYEGFNGNYSQLTDNSLVPKRLVYDIVPAVEIATEETPAGNGETTGFFGVPRIAIAPALRRLAGQFANIASQIRALSEADAKLAKKEWAFNFFSELDTVSALRVVRGRRNFVDFYHSAKLSGIAYQVWIGTETPVVLNSLQALQTWQIDRSVGNSTVWHLEVVANFGTNKGPAGAVLIEQLAL